MPTYRAACCLTCRSEIIVNPGFLTALGPIPEGSVCANCIWAAELPADEPTP